MRIFWLITFRLRRVKFRNTWISWWRNQALSATSSLTMMVRDLFLKWKFAYIGIPVKSYPEDKIPAVQYAALIVDLVIKTKQTLKQLNSGDSEFVYLRMRTKQDTEMIITDYIVPGTSYEYILVCLQNCNFQKEPEEVTESKWFIIYTNF